MEGAFSVSILLSDRCAATVWSSQGGGEQLCSRKAVILPRQVPDCGILEQAELPLAFRPVAADPQIVCFVLNLSTIHYEQTVELLRKLAQHMLRETNTAQLAWALSERFDE